MQKFNYLHTNLLTLLFFKDLIIKFHRNYIIENVF